MKKILSILIAVAALFIVSTGCYVYAENTVECTIEDVSAQNTELTITVKHKQGDDFKPVTEKSSLYLGKQECSILKIENLNEAGIGVVYDCIVDVSGSMDQTRIDLSKKMLRELVKQKKEQDVFRISRMGNEKISSEYMTDAEKINEAIDKISLTREDTNLYDSLKQELVELQTNNELPSRRCLIIFSDGAEDQKKGITLEEALQIVTESKIPVFTVAMLKDNVTDMQLDAAKILGQLGRSSYGGIHFAPLIDQWEYEDVVPKIEAVCNDSLIITADFSMLQLQSDAASIELVLASDEYIGTIRYDMDSEMAMQLFLNGRSQEGELSQERELLQESVSNDTVQSKKSDNKNNTMNYGRIIIVVIIIVLIITIGVTIILISSSDREKNHEERKTGHLCLVFQRLSDGLEIKEKLKTEILFGRSDNCNISVTDDSGLSEEHCIFILENGNVYVKDNNSTNGTYVNGIPQIGMCLLHQGDVLLIGSAEYTVSWK